MTLPTSGPISIQAIAGEFGGSAPYLMSNYYAGGPHVPSGTSGTNGAVPTSGALSLTKFYGTSAAIETQVVTVGEYLDFGIPLDIWGYNGGFCGSMTPRSSTIYSGYAWGEIDWYNGVPGTPTATGNVQLNIFGTAGFAPNSGWTTVTINGHAFSRASLSYSTTFNSPYFISIWRSGLVLCPFTQTIGATNNAVFS